MRGEVGFSVSAFCLVDVLAGLSRVHIRASVAVVMPIVKERKQNLCTTAALITFMMDTTSVSRKVPTGSQIRSLSAATTIFQARTPYSKIVYTKKITGTSPLSEFQPHISIVVSATSNTKEIPLGTFCLDTDTALSLISMKWCNLLGLIVKPKFRVTITYASSKVLDIVGTASIAETVPLTLDVDLGDIMVNLKDFF